jgi:hypothetical protein
MNEKRKKAASIRAWSSEEEKKKNGKKSGKGEAKQSECQRYVPLFGSAVPDFRIPGPGRREKQRE